MWFCGAEICHRTPSIERLCRGEYSGRMHLITSICTYDADAENVATINVYAKRYNILSGAHRYSTLDSYHRRRVTRQMQIRSDQGESRGLGMRAQHSAVCRQNLLAFDVDVNRSHQRCRRRWWRRHRVCFDWSRFALQCTLIIYLIIYYC